MNKIIPLYATIEEDLMDDGTDESQEDNALSTLKQNLRHQLKLKFESEFRPEFRIATFLTPEFKDTEGYGMENVDEEIQSYAAKIGINV